MCYATFFNLPVIQLKILFFPIIWRLLTVFHPAAVSANRQQTRTFKKSESLVEIEFKIILVSLFCRCKTRLDQLAHNFRYSQGLVDQKLSKHIATGLRDLLRCELFPEDTKMCTSYPGHIFYNQYYHHLTKN